MIGITELLTISVARCRVLISQNLMNMLIKMRKPFSYFNVLSTVFLKFYSKPTPFYFALGNFFINFTICIRNALFCLFGSQCFIVMIKFSLGSVR